jgi:hypothetical protein
MTITNIEFNLYRKIFVLIYLSAMTTNIRYTP